MPTHDPFAHQSAPAPGSTPPTAAEVANQQAAQLLKRFLAAQPEPDGYVAGRGMPCGSDIPKPHGLYTRHLIGPTSWPTESENEFRRAAKEWTAFHQRHEDASYAAKSATDQVFAYHWTEGEGVAAARAHYEREHRTHLDVVALGKAGAGMYGRLGNDVERAKRLIRDAHDAAHKDIEAYLQAPGGKSIATVGAIIGPYRTLIEGYSAGLREKDGAEALTLTDQLGPPQAPANAGGESGRGTDSSTGGRREDSATEPQAGRDTGAHGVDESTGARQGAPGSGSSGTGDPATHTPGQGSDAASDRVGVDAGAGIHGADLSGDSAGAAESVASNPGRATDLSTGLLAAGKPPMPSTAAASGGSSPLGGVGAGSGAPGSFGRGPASGLGLSPPAGGSASSGPGAVSGAAPPGGSAAGVGSGALGEQFGRGVAAGSGAAGAVPPVGTATGVPPTPRAPLAAPIASAPGAAAPAGALPSASAGAVAAAPASGGGVIPAAGAAAGAPVMGGGMPPPMTPYGSVLPSAAAPGAAGGVGSSAISGAPPAPPITGGNAAPGLVPMRNESSAPVRIGRDVSQSDLEVARAAVADLAAASCVVYPGLEWAVVASRGSSGAPELWVASNEGASYIPRGVHLARRMPLARVDDRWFGWFNPAETAIRAVRAMGATVSAVATTWALASEMVAEATPDVALAVAASSLPERAEASRLTPGRSHRLETVAPAIYHGLANADAAAREAYARRVTQEVVFGGGAELSPLAQSAGRAIVAARRPGAGEWAALREEYEHERLIAGSQRPGLQGVEQPEQRNAYQRDFVLCRRLETLLCWEDATPADVVYAAAAAGATLPPAPV